MKVLWMVNCALSPDDQAGTGSWLYPMLRGVVDSGVSVSVLAAAPVGRIQRHDCGPIEQWLVPIRLRAGRDGLPASHVVRRIVELTNQIEPDLIHVWGTEFYWGLLTARGLFQMPTVLTMQGIKHRVGAIFDGQLTFREQIASFGPKELARLIRHGGVRSSFIKWERFEREIMGGHDYVCCQSMWQGAHVRARHLDATVLYLHLPVRQEFMTAPAWTRPSGPVRLLTTFSYSSPGKGLHVALRALAILRRLLPNVQLRIAGKRSESRWLPDGYLRWLDAEVSRLGLQANVTWLGGLNAADLVKELTHARAMVIPSLLESYGVSMAEATIVGTPVVTTFTGGTPSLGRDEVSCLFFPAGDETMCAYQLQRLIEEPELATSLSAEGRTAAIERHDYDRIVRGQIAIYQQVLEEN